MEQSKVTFSIYLPNDKRYDLSPIYNILRQCPYLMAPNVTAISYVYGGAQVDIVTDIYASTLRDEEKENVKKAINGIVSLMLEMS